MTTIPPPIAQIASSPEILAISNGPGINIHNALSFKLLAQYQPSIEIQAANLKAHLVRLIACGYSAPEIVQGVEEVRPVVAFCSEDKKLRVVLADSGQLVYERTMIKKGRCLSVEDGGVVIVTDIMGDVFAYPYAPDTNGEPSQSSKQRPEPIELAVDPSLNPDADLLLGHVSTVASHIITQDGRKIITCDRDEHIRVSRYPKSYIIESYLSGHDTFVSAILNPSAHPDILLSGGGSTSILLHSISSTELLSQIPVGPSIKPYRTVRSTMRRVRKRRPDGMKGPHVQPDLDAAEVSDVKIKGLTDEEWRTAPTGFSLPSGEGICLSKMEEVAGKAVFFSTGCSALHSFSIPLAANLEVPATIHSVSLPYPALSFAPLPSAPGSPTLIAVSTDPVWEDRVDGGKAFYPQHVEGPGRKPVNVPTAETSVSGKGKARAERPIEEVIGGSEKALRIISLEEDGQLRDVTEDQASLIEELYSSLTPVDATASLSIPLYQELSILPKWIGQEEDDDLAGYDAQSVPFNDGQENRGKRALGRLRAQGLDVKIPVTKAQKVKKLDAWKQRKKQRREKLAGDEVKGEEQDEKEDEDMAVLEEEMNA